MFTFIETGGPFGWLILILALVNTVLVIRKAIQLGSDKPVTGNTFESGLNAILFWGIICAVLGFLGQYTGIYNAMGAISKATELSPAVMARGFGQSFTTTLMGLNVLVLSAIAWFVLHTLYQRMKRDQGGRATP